MIITSLLDTDLYKLTMMQSALHQFSTTNVRYEFKCRNKVEFTQGMLVRINDEITQYCRLQFTEEELDYLSGIRFFKADFIDFLRLYKPNKKHVDIWLDKGELRIEVDGPWYLTMPFEVPILAIVNQVFFDTHNTANHWISGAERLNAKYEVAKKEGFSFSDFGTRRRYSKHWQESVVEKFLDLPNFTGTSNVYLAKKYNITPIGTMAHEYIMAGAGQNDVPLVKSQQKMLQSWVEEYRGDLGIALSDTYGFDAFLDDFDLYFAKLYDGLRHDSGDPYTWADKAIAHYKKLGIDPMTKTLVFSDGLTMEKCSKIYSTYKDKTKLSFGIGTHLTNDFEGITPLQIVMKIVSCNGRPVAKVSDSVGKGMCKDASFVEYVRKVFNIGGNNDVYNY